MKILRKMSWMLIAMTAVMTMASCSDDKDEPGDGKDASAFVGTWQENDKSTDKFIRVFNADGTGYDRLMNPPYYDVTEDFTWSYSGNQLMKDYGDDPEPEQITWIDDDTYQSISIRKDGTLHDEIDTFRRVKE